MIRDTQLAPAGGHPTPDPVPDFVHYVYGVIRADAPFTGNVEGVDDAPVSVETVGGLAMLVSSLPAASYSPSRIEAGAASVDWVGPRAVAHDRVLTWASDRTAVIPFPMFSSMWASRDAARAMVQKRAAELESALERVGRGREYALRLYRVDAELRASLGEFSDEMRALADEAARATPGQRYLIERKGEEKAKTETRAVAQRVAGEVRDGLASHSLASATSPIPRSTAADAPGTMVLNAAFLVAPAALDDFRRALTAMVDRYQTRGFRFDFTGPWPPYHFANANDD
jgi:hypothetical protein